jgi:ABC-2 type transport system permease protein
MNNKIKNEVSMMNSRKFSLTNFGKFPTLMVREFYEHRTAFSTVPLVIAGLFLFFAIGGLITGQGEVLSINGNHMSAAELLSMHANEKDLHTAQQALSAIMMGVGGSIMIILPFVIIFPLLNSLYEERIERSYLFWKSMPVSDLQEVLVKLTFIVFAGPMILFAIASLLSFAIMIAVTPFLWANDLPFISLMWAQTPFISGWVGVAATYLVWALWALPIFGWILLASAYAPKAPLMYAVVPPIVLMVIEKMFLGTEWFDQVVVSRIGEKFGHTMVSVVDMDRYNDGAVNFNAPTIGEAGQILGASLADPSFWMGSAVAAAFIMGAVYVRRYRI